MRRRSPISPEPPPDSYAPHFSVGYDYNYDPARTSLSSYHNSAFDPYSDQEPSTSDSAPDSVIRHHERDLEYMHWNDSTNFGSESLFRHKDRSPRPESERSSTPPNVPVPASPTPQYLQISQELSKRLENPASTRKLLILDLNGTLVFRSPRPRREYRPRPQSEQSALRPLRTVHGRPFLDTFSQYLFHPQTRDWLDTMVWSSAQPHSVSDMVDKCFGSRQTELVAIWARDTLGLDATDYNRKVQTTKDLAKPWAALPLQPRTTENSESHPAQKHSAETTLLLDDSTLKAHLQPWNHLCIQEYVAKMRSWDVTVRDSEVAFLGHDGSAAVGETPTVEAIPDANVVSEIELDALEDHSPQSEGAQPLNKKKRKRDKKDRKRQEKYEASGRPTTDFLHRYDQTLLAVVGILDAIKHESNVAGWMRNGGLLNNPNKPDDAIRDGVATNDDTLQSADGGQNMRKKIRVLDDTENEDNGGSYAITEELDSSLPSNHHSLASHNPKQDDLEPQVGEVATGIPMDNGVPPTVDHNNSRGHSPPLSGLWFENELAMKHWSDRGVRALEELGIEIVSGVVGSFG